MPRSPLRLTAWIALAIFAALTLLLGVAGWVALAVTVLL